MSKLIDISVSVTDRLASWPGADKFMAKRISDKANGDFATNTIITTDVHFGTHLDAPLHHIPQGKSIDQINLQFCTGICSIMHFPDKELITAKDLENKISENPGLLQERILLKTDNSRYQLDKPSEFLKSYCAIDISAARWLVDNEVKLIGIDYYSIQKFTDPADVHEILLENEILILETIQLAKTEEKLYELFCLPIKLEGLEAAPCRAVLKNININY